MAHSYLYNSIAPSTRQTYSAGFSSYKLFAATFGVPNDQLLPATTSSVALWISWLAGMKLLSFKTIKTYLAGLAATALEFGYKDPIKDNVLIYQLLRGIKRTIGIKDKQPRLPITSAIIRSIIGRIPRYKQCFEDKLLFAAASTGTFGLLRAGEFVQTDNNQTSLLTLSQLSLFNVQNNPINIHTASAIELAHACYYVIHLHQSKADPFRFGADVVIGSTIAVQAMIDYLITHPAKSLPTATLFSHKDGHNLTRSQLISNIRDHLIQSNIKNAHLYHGHSFRKGGAQTLKELGIDPQTIQLLGRWASDAHTLYTTTPISMRLATNQRM
jgi:hypothetical protein